MKRLWCSLILVAAGLLSLPAIAVAAEYETYVGCGLAFTTAPSESCQVGEPLGAFFEADEDTEYEVCVEFPSGNYLCAEEQLAEEGVLNVNSITSDVPGQHFVDWYVGEDQVGEWAFQLNAPAPPPTPPAPPAPPAPAPPAPAPPAPTPPAVAPKASVACLKAKARVGKFRAQLRKADEPKAKTMIRGKLNNARAAVKRLC